MEAQDAISVLETGMYILFYFWFVIYTCTYLINLNICSVI